MPCVTDLEGFTYLQQERKGVILGVYERNPRHWQTEGAEWDYGMELLPEDIDRISPELLIGFSRFPSLQRAGIRKWVNGAFTFTPDGNPLVGPVPGLRNFWAACGCMGGFSQGGAIGKVLAEWMVEGDPGTDIFGMDVARYGKFAADDRYLRDTTAQFYARRFVIAYPNEELPAGRPLKTTPSYEAQKALGARFGVVWGMESPQYFATGEPDFVEPPTLRRSAADRFVAAEVAATRTAAGLLDTGVYARYEVRGPGAGKWLDYLVASRLPAVGRIRLAPMLNPAGRLMGDLTVTRLDEDRYWLVGSYYLQEWHLRWFHDHLPAAGVEIENLSESWLGFSLSGPRSREILASLTHGDVSDRGLPFMGCASIEVGPTTAVVARLSLTGELGYEINVHAVAAARTLAGIDGRRHSAGHAPDRHARAGQPAARKGLRRLVARVLHDLHASDGGSGTLRRCGQGRLHRARCVSGCAGGRPRDETGAAAGRCHPTPTPRATSRSIATADASATSLPGRTATTCGRALRWPTSTPNGAKHPTRCRSRFWANRARPGSCAHRPTIQRARNCVADVQRIRGGDA